MNFKIYGLKIIGEENIRYIGLTKNSLRKRINNHKNHAKGRETHKDRWVRKNDYNIEIILIEDGIPNLNEANEREVYWIKYYRDLGYDLVNTSDGGNGTVGVKPTQAHKDHLSSLFKGVPLSEEHRKKIGLARKGKKLSEKHINSLKKGKENISEETRYKMKINKYKEWLIKNNHIEKENNLTNNEIIDLRDKIRFDLKEKIKLERELKKLELKQLQDKIKNEELEIKKSKELEIEKQKEEKNKLKEINKLESNLKAELKHQEVLERKRLKEENLKNKIELGLLRVIEKEDGRKLYLPIMTEEQKQDRAEYNRNKVVSEKTKNKLSQTLKQLYIDNPERKRKPTEEQKEHLRKINTGKKYSEETKFKHSIHSRGNGNGCAKISEDDVREIRRLFESGEKSKKLIAEQFNMDYSTIAKIIARKLWKHVE